LKNYRGIYGVFQSINAFRTQLKGVTKKTECSRFSYPNHSILNISKPNFQEIIY